jgi:hypothetical protein
VNGAHTIYSDDEDVEKFAKRCGIAVVKTWELPLPAAEQTNLLAEIERLESKTVEREDESKKESFNLVATPEPVPEHDEPTPIVENADPNPRRARSFDNEKKMTSPNN